MIRVSALHKRFGGTIAVGSIDLEIARGELFGLVGPDGAGKTTVLRMLAGVLRPDGGEAVLDGVSVVARPEAVKHHIAYMSQRFGLYADLTVRENLDFYADLYRVPSSDRPARLERLFQFSQLGPFQDRLAGKLSGGMKQKLGLSCALVHQPMILLLDEPTFGVDPISRRDLWLIVHEMVAQGVTAIVATSYLDEAERFDRVAMLHRGNVLALDTPEGLRAGLAGRLVGVAVDRPHEAKAALDREPAAQRAVVFGERLHVVVGSAERDIDGVVAALGGAGFQVSGAEPIEPSLEDVFLDRIATAEDEAPS